MQQGDQNPSKASQAKAFSLQKKQQTRSSAVYHLQKPYQYPHNKTGLPKLPCNLAFIVRTAYATKA
jgi:hypothetical protein